VPTATTTDRGRIVVAEVFRHALQAIPSTAFDFFDNFYFFDFGQKTNKRIRLEPSIGQ